MNGQVTLVATTYNNADHVHLFIDSCLHQTFSRWELILIDDGSNDKTVDVIRKFAVKDKRIRYQVLPHGERGIARVAGMLKAVNDPSEYIFFLDSDMLMEPDMLDEAIEYMTINKQIGALVIPEIPISRYVNYWTKVKVFERRILNNAGKELDSRSIEAARFWRKEAYLQSGGLEPNQIAFEEIQPTIRFMETGGLIKRLEGVGVFHNEKQVILKDLLMKKAYYFSVMDRTIKTERKGFIKALKRWYFFRPVLYRKSNLILYVKEPDLFIGMCIMYALLTGIAIKALMKSTFLKTMSITS